MQAVRSKVGSRLEFFLDRLSGVKEYVERLKRDVKSLDPSLNLVKECGALLNNWIPIIESHAKSMKQKLPTTRTTSQLASDCKLLLNDIKIVIDSQEIIANEVSKLPVGATLEYLPHTLDIIKDTVTKLWNVAAQILKLLEDFSPDVNKITLFKFSTEIDKKKQLETMKAREKERVAVENEMEDENQMEKEATMVEKSIEEASRRHGWTPDFKKCVSVLSKYKARSEPFIKLLAQIESGLCSDKCANVIEIETAQEYNKLTDAVLRNNGCIIRGLIEEVGLEVPDVTFENLGSFDDGRKHNFVDSSTGSSIKKSLKDFGEERKKRDAGEKHVILNLLSDEITGTGHDFKLPQLLLLKSVICQIENSSNLSENDSKLKDLFLQKIGRMTRYLIVSMKHSFTDLHVDPAGSSVYYHVIKGKKVVWMAPPTEENLDLYKRFEIESTHMWNVAKCLQEFQRVEIREGNTLLIPPAWPHFVYTPVDTIVVGGNYLKLEDVDLHFKVVQIEKETNADPKLCFPFFWDTMYAFVQLVLIPKLKKARESGKMTEEDKATAKMMHSHLYSQLHPDEQLQNKTAEKKNPLPVLFNQTIREEIVKSLNEFITQYFYNYCSDELLRKKFIMSLQQPKPPSANSQHEMKTKLMVDEINENLEQMLTRLESGKTFAVRLDQDLEGLKSHSNTNLLNEDGNVIRNSASIVARLTKDLKNEVLLDETGSDLVRSCGELVDEIQQAIKVLGRIQDDVSKFIPGSYPKSVNTVLNLLANIFEGVLKVSLSTLTTLKKLELENRKKQQNEDHGPGLSDRGGRPDSLERDDEHTNENNESTNNNEIAEKSLKRNQKRHGDSSEDNADSEPQIKNSKLDQQETDHAATARNGSDESNLPTSSETALSSQTHVPPYKQQSNTEHTEDKKLGQTSAGSATSVIKTNMSDEEKIAYGVDAFKKLNRTPIAPDRIDMLRKFLALTPTNLDFNRLFGELEKTMFRNSEKHIKCSNGEDFVSNRGLDPKQDKVYVIEVNDDKFGLKSPQFTFGSLKQSATALKKTSTRRIQAVGRSMLKIIEQIDKKDLSQPSQIVVCLSQEIKKPGEIGNIQAPDYVKQESLICKLVNKAMNEFGSQANSTKLNAILTHLADSEFLSVSTAMSFTDLHMAPAATCVYFHVLVGQKVMFLAPPSPDNLELFYHYKRTAQKTDKTWFVSLYAERFERIEVNEGQTISIPSGWLCFDFNPTETIVIGGYYLRKNDIDFSIKIKKFEEETSVAETDQTEALPNYWCTLFVYSDLMFSRTFEAQRNNSTTNEMRVTAETLYTELSTDKLLNTKSWYHIGFRKDVIIKLGNFLGKDAETATRLKKIAEAKAQKKT